MKSRLRTNEIDSFNDIKDSFLDSASLKKDFDNADFNQVVHILKTTHRNDNQNIFPDFLFDGGIIEHFEVTASRESRKGSSYKIKEILYKQESDDYFKEMDCKHEKESYHSGIVTVEKCEHIFDDFSYQWFKQSFEKNMKHHLDSLRKSLFKNSKVVFLIQVKSGRLCIYEDDVFNRFYRLCEDRSLLQLLKEEAKDVDYIFFHNNDAFEIIDLSKIDILIEYAKASLDVRKGRSVFLDFKVNFNL